VEPAGRDDLDSNYSRDLAGEGEYWDNFIADRLLNHDEIPGSVDFRIFFTQFSRKHNWGPPCLGPVAINFREREVRYVLIHAARRPGMRVLDLGCGAGWLSLELARQGAHITAVDISKTNLALGRYMVENNARNFPYLYQRFAGLQCRLEEFGSVEYVYGDLNNITLPRAEFDAVVVWDSLHHITDLELLLAKIRTTLKPDGIFVGVDHAFATQATADYNGAIIPWLKDFLSWVDKTNPEWMYKQVASLFQQRDWGVLGVDYSVEPVPGFAAFEAQVRDEMLEIIKAGVKQDALERLQARPLSAGDQSQAAGESPFEDVSAERLMRTLIEQFEVEQFSTTCPLIVPERYFPPPRSEAERIFQHHISAMLVEINERAIERGQADGQWFLFHLTPNRPSTTNHKPALERILNSTTVESARQIAQSAEEQRLKLAEREAYAATLENALAEIARKDDALEDMSAKVRQLEAELTEARKPRLPWKRPR